MIKGDKTGQSLYALRKMCNEQEKNRKLFKWIIIGILIIAGAVFLKSFPSIFYSVDTAPVFRGIK
jgi:hypothetical protein